MIGKVCQSVVVGLILQLFLVPLALCDVFQSLNCGEQISFAVADGSGIEKNVAIHAVEVFVPSLSLQSFRNEV